LYSFILISLVSALIFVIYFCLPILGLACLGISKILVASLGYLRFL
jgi:hypothetical protein